MANMEDYNSYTMNNTLKSVSNRTKAFISCTFLGGFFLIFIYSEPINNFVNQGIYNNQNGLLVTEAYKLELIEDYMEKTTEFLLQNRRCKIPDLDAFNSDAVRFFKREKYKPCHKRKLLTYITKEDNKAILHIDNNVLPSYGKDLVCCYSYVTRKDEFSIATSECKPFKKNITLTNQVVTIKCTKGTTKVYENTHTFVPPMPTNETQKNITNSLSVLFLGIDSISRLNFIRSMPKTKEFLDKTQWISLNAYNKMGDNTFPNLMAIFTGMNRSRAYDVCQPTIKGRLDKCPIIWYRFKEHGYITGYAEDESNINTFNYKKKGFVKPPTSYYFRPYFMAAEKLKARKRGSLRYCTGPENTGERVFNIGKDFAITLQNYTNFGFFWSNSFSHNDLNIPSGMDDTFREYFEDLEKSGVLNKSIVIFLSDHGIRFGGIRQTFTGWLEERLPFFYVSFPQWFKETFSNEYNAFKINANRLTTPYDIYMTLQHILVLTGQNYTVVPSEGCPKCKSLFTEVDIHRSCDDASIEPHWCTCAGYTPINKDNLTVVATAKFIVESVNNKVESFREKSKCAKLYFSKVLSSYISELFIDNKQFLLLTVKTSPSAIFEATVRVDKNKQFSLVGGISRVEYYQTLSSCAKDSDLKLYCRCK